MARTQEKSLDIETLARRWRTLGTPFASAKWAIPMIVVLSTGAGLVLRLAELQLMEFRLDSAFWSLEALKIIRGEPLPLVGQQVGSVTVPLYNGPVFSYFVALIFRLIGTSPVYPTVVIASLGAFAAPITYLLGQRLYGARVGLFALVFTAFSPWLVLYNRMLWPQSLFPFLVPVTIALLYEGVVRSNSRLLFLWGILVGICIQLHLSALPLALAGLIFVMFYRRRLRSIALPIFGLIVGYSPLLLYDVLNGWVNLRGFLSLPDNRIALDQGWLLRALKFGWNLENMLSGQGLWVSKLSSGETYLPDWVELGQGLLVSILALSAAVALMGKWIGSGARRIFQCPSLATKADVLLVLYLTLPLGGLLFSGGPILRHFFLVVLPVAFLLLARGCQSIRAQMQPWLWAGTSLVVVLNLITNLTMLDYVDKVRSGGDYGTVLADKVQAVDWILEDSKGQFVLDASRSREALSYDFLLSVRFPVQFDEARGIVSAVPSSSQLSCMLFEPDYYLAPAEAVGKPQIQIGGIRVLELKPNCASSK